MAYILSFVMLILYIVTEDIVLLLASPLYLIAGELSSIYNEIHKQNKKE